ncbi:MAG: HAD-IA family hydrolase [Kiritimatiellae bacterium]|nr:HAD-IA family hydrolase [Kiritimatiellia bacterium]
MSFVEGWLARAAQVDGVVFDFGGVISVSPREGWSLYPFCAARGVGRAAVDAGWARYRHLWDGGFISFEEMYRRMFADAGVGISDADLAELWEIDAVAWIRDLRADTLELMRALKARGRRIGILTNMSPDFHERLFVPRAAAYRALADAEVVSGLERLYKPERPIYDLMARRMGLPPGRLLFVDDTPANVEAARGYGWQAEVYR